MYQVQSCMLHDACTCVNNASGMIRYTRCEEHTEGERFMSASSVCKDGDKVQEILVYLRVHAGGA